MFDKKVSLTKDIQTSNSTVKRPRKSNVLPTKIVIRHLPPTLSSEQFVEQVGPISDHNYYYYVKGDLSLGEFSFSRAYINFIHQQDILIFREKFDNYVFLDDKGNEYPAIVELAAYQGFPKRRKKVDPRCKTIESDPNFIAFIENKENPEASLPTVQDCLEEIEAKEKEVKSDQVQLTPLLDFINNASKLKQIEPKNKSKSKDKKREDLKKKKDRKAIRSSKEWQPSEPVKITTSPNAVIVVDSTTGDNVKDTKKRIRRKREEKKKDVTFAKTSDERTSSKDIVKEKKYESNRTERNNRVLPNKSDADKPKTTFTVKILVNEKRNSTKSSIDDNKARDSKTEARSIEKIRNKDRPSVQLYRPSPRSSQTTQSVTSNKQSDTRESVVTKKSTSQEKSSSSRRNVS